MRTNKTLRIASVLLIAVLMTTCIIGGTFAKYTTTISATAFGNIAKWDVKANNDTTGLSFNLADTIKDSDTTSAEEDVKSGKIAPGTSGSFAITLKNDSEVTTCAVITLEGTNIPENMTFSMTAVDGAVYAYDDDSDTITVTVANLAIDAETTITLNWVWVFTDTVENSLSAGIVSLSGNIVFTQVD